MAFLLFFKRDNIWWTGKQQASSSFILFIVHVYCSVPHKYYFTSRSKTFLLEFLCLDFTSSSLTYFPWIFLCIVWRSDWGSLFFFVYEYPINPILFENICVCLYIYTYLHWISLIALLEIYTFRSVNQHSVSIAHSLVSGKFIVCLEFR